MKSADKILDKQIPYIALIGPFVILTALFVVLLKTSIDYTYFPLMGLAGIILCWKWQRNGLIASLFLLAFVILYKCMTIPVDERIWHLAFSFSLASGFIISALSFEEIEAFQIQPNQESNSHLLEAKLQSLQEKHQIECNAFSAKIQLIQQTANQFESRLHIQNDTINSLHQELSQSKTQTERLNQELLQKNYEITSSQTQLEQFQNQIDKLLAASQSTEDHALQLTREKEGLESNLMKLQREKETLHEQSQHQLKLIESHLNMIHLLKQTMEEQEQRIQHENDKANKALTLHTEKEKSLQNDLAQATQQLETALQQTIDSNAIKELYAEAQNQIEILNEEKQTLQQRYEQLSLQHASAVIQVSATTQAWHRHEGMYNQLKEQFAEKSAILDDTRGQLFQTQEKLSRLQREYHELQNYHHHTEEIEMNQHMIQMEHECTLLSQEVELLHEIITKLSTHI